jgi:2,4-dienoyl-CoA reductase-like NADH-dependent reductase (Old Yellow Enzyme family)
LNSTDVRSHALTLSLTRAPRSFVRSPDTFEAQCKGRTVFIRAGGYTPDSAKKALANGHGDAIAFGRLFLANPDLPRRIREGLEVNAYQRDTFYTQDPVVGYTDYPFYSE